VIARIRRDSARSNALDSVLATGRPDHHSKATCLGSGTTSTVPTYQHAGVDYALSSGVTCLTMPTTLHLPAPTCGRYGRRGRIAYIGMYFRCPRSIGASTRVEARRSETLTRAPLPAAYVFSWAGSIGDGETDLPSAVLETHATSKFNRCILCIHSSTVEMSAGAINPPKTSWTLCGRFQPMQF
jgi:hypothetical protein